MSFEPPHPYPSAQNVAAALDPTASYLNSSCLEFLLIELVPTAYRMAAELATREAEWTGTNTTITSSTPSAKASRSRSGTAASASTSRPAAGGGDATSVAPSLDPDDDEIRSHVAYRLEMVGYRVGLGIVERFSRDKARFTDTLDCIKFLCKDIWTLVFRKQIDNLKTNHRGVYVLTDNAFRPLSKISPERGVRGEEVLGRAVPFLWFPQGLVRGSLAAMGIDCSVVAETSQLPGVTFQIKTLGSKA